MGLELAFGTELTVDPNPVSIDDCGQGTSCRGTEVTTEFVVCAKPVPARARVTYFLADSNVYLFCLPDGTTDKELRTDVFDASTECDVISHVLKLCEGTRGVEPARFFYLYGYVEEVGGDDAFMLPPEQVHLEGA